MEDNKCPMCGCLVKPVNGMTQEVHLSKSILTVYRGIQEDYNGEIPLPCPRCGKPMNTEHNGNVVSRHEDISICEECGIDEIEREARDDELPVSEWHIVNVILFYTK